MKLSEGHPERIFARQIVANDVGHNRIDYLNTEYRNHDGEVDVYHRFKTPNRRFVDVPATNGFYRAFAGRMTLRPYSYHPTIVRVVQINRNNNNE